MTLFTLSKRAQNLSRMQLRPARFAALLFLLSGAQLAWAQAPVPVVPGVAPVAKPKGPTTIDAQTIEGVSELEVTARGQVEFQREDLTIYSEFLRYNQEFGRVEADGGVRMQRGVERYFGPRLRYNTQNDTGVFEGLNYSIPGETTTSRGKAERLEFLGKDRLRMVKGTFTTCEPGKEDWRFEAGELELDNERQVGTVRDGRLKFFDTTILPLPYGSFSLDKQRKSGFLAPYYSHNTQRGFEVAVPYYWNIAPEQDLLLVPGVMSKRGAQLKSDYRFLGQTYRGEARYDVIPHDKILGTSRSAFSLQHEQLITPGLRAIIDYNKASDSRYFVDLSSQVRQVSAGILPQQATVLYNSSIAGTGYYINSLVQRYQTLQDPLAPITPPYARLPQINFGTTKNDIAGRFDLTVPGEFVRFSHPTLTDGTRVQFNPTLTAPIIAPGYFLTPKLGMHYAGYNLRQTVAGQPDKQSIALPWMSLDGGLIFDRDANWFGRQLTQTFEPRIFYVYAPYRNQDKIPLFDTALADFNYAQIFTENRFAGGDRFGDANQVTMAATSRLLTLNGEELFRATLGQRYYFSDERVALTPGAALRSRDQSDLLASIGARFTKAFTFDAAVQYNPQLSRAERYSVSARFAPEIAKVISASYRYNRDPALPIRQMDLSGQWPVQPGWYAIGRFNYSFQDRRLLEGIAGVEYNAGCWVFRGAFQRIQAAVQTTSTGMFFQLEFNGFGGLGSDEILQLFKRNVPGYAVTNPTQGNLVPPSVHPRLPFEQVF
jgi:LPS-assembly protein